MTAGKHLRRIAPAIPTVSVLTVLAVTLCSCAGGSGNGVIKASGSIEATEVNVSSRAAGEIIRLCVDEGDRVSVGDTVSLIDTAIYAMQLRQAEAAVDLADAQYRLLINGARSEDIRAAEEAVTQAKAALKVAEDDATRMDELFASNTVTKKQKDDADARLTVAQAQFTTAQQTLKKVRTFARSEDKQSAEARLHQAEAARDVIRKTLSDCSVVAPANGIVTNRPVEAGELAGLGSVIVTISKLDTVNLMIYVNETALSSIKLGQAAEVTIDAFPDRTFEGRVIFISPNAEFTPKNVQTEDERTKLVFGVKLEVPNPDGLLKPGMPADAAVRTS